MTDPFEYEVKTGEGAGTVLTLPSLNHLKMKVIRRTRNLSDLDRTCTILEMLLSDKDLDAVDDMDPDEFNDMALAWREHSNGLTVGES